MVETGGLLGLIHLAIVIYAVIKIFQSAAGTGVKVLWVLIVLVLPILGLILWLIFGPKG